MVSSRTLGAALFALGSLLWLNGARAATFEACPVPDNLLPAPEALSLRTAPDAPVTVDADEAVYDRSRDTFIFTGDVLLERADQTLRADRLLYHEPTNRVDAIGDVLIEGGGLSLTAEQGFLYTQESRGELEEVYFRLTPGFSHGLAEEAELLSPSLSRFERVRFTACPPEDEDWWLAASQITLNKDEGFGTARNAYLTFLGVPLLYTPYISFPIDDRRKSGLLPPRFGYSDDTGVDITIPYYLNLAPNYDATLRPRLLTRRGLLLGVEGRLLRPRFAAETDLQYLPEDQLFGGDRWSASLDVRSLTTGPFYFAANLARVSDNDYLDDFGDSLATVSQTHLPSSLVAGYRAERWSLGAQALTWQNLDPLIAEQYRVLPRLTASYSGPLDDDLVDYGFAGELVRFQHPSATRIDGSRLTLMPTVSLPYERLAYFAIPRLTLSHTQYHLEQTTPGAPEQLDRTLPIFSLDSGIFLERELSLGGERLLQTLEPRLFYLYVPHENQDALPLFDTTLAEPSLAQLFRVNRFTGTDRIGDANQISLALGTRFLDRSSGREYLYAAVGQAFFLDERRVTLSPGQPADTRDSSLVLAEGRAHLGTLTAYADYAWDPRPERTARQGLRVSYRPGPWRAVNLGYRERTELLPGTPLEQIELSAVWPIRDRWLGLGGWHYSLREDTTLERFAGFAYKSCCWTFRAVAREFVSEAGQDPNLSFMFQLELTGLGALGDPLDEFLLETISGFQFQR